ncbi:AAA family ATPase [Cellulomonas uda]|uniref:ORC1/DEAH AAA+ ATPase domain-containing protein n=1 Tax=Cellulomonas uda TaxID=1714 RepID=A0A4Y3KE44_CELUD|nr:AAA family ATPase [Cellulomonas uda]NII67528.1 hypothetical protein [Cellulomonas uda]GEA81278.1 hypothetical protein CUD01_17220 [Cellulomonas uda]
MRDAVVSRTHVVVTGLPGSGRSHVLAQVRAALPDDVTAVEVRTVRGEGRPLESLALAGLLSGPAAPSAIASAVDQLAHRVAGRRAVLLVDDADRLDPASAAVVAAAVPADWLRETDRAVVLEHLAHRGLLAARPVPLASHLTEQVARRARGPRTP